MLLLYYIIEFLLLNCDLKNSQDSGRSIEAKADTMKLLFNVAINKTIHF